VNPHQKSPAPATGRSPCAARLRAGRFETRALRRFVPEVRARERAHFACTARALRRRKTAQGLGLWGYTAAQKGIGVGSQGARAWRILSTCPSNPCRGRPAASAPRAAYRAAVASAM